MKEQNKRIILASKSERRREILKKAGFVFDVFVSQCEEKDIVGEKYSKELAIECAREKAENAYKELKQSYEKDKNRINFGVNGIGDNKTYLDTFNPMILACDTIVVCDNIIIGKPKDREDAIRILKKLSTTPHQVVSSVCLIKNNECKVGQDVSEVRFKKINDEQIIDYVDKFNPLDKAGAYGIQDEGFDFVESITGNMDNVVGLPMKVVNELLK